MRLAPTWEKGISTRALSGWGRQREHVVGFAEAVPTITSFQCISRVADPEWVETWGESCIWGIAGLTPGIPATFNVKLFNIAEDIGGGGPFLDTGRFKVEINGTDVGIIALSKLAPTPIGIPVDLINPDGSTSVRIYGSPNNYYVRNIEVSVDQPGAPGVLVVGEGVRGWIADNKALFAAGIAIVIVAGVVLARR